MTSIVYSTKSGSSKRYAESLSSRTGLPVYSVDDCPDQGGIIFFGWLRGSSVVGASSLDMSRVSAVGVVGLDDEGRFDKPGVTEKNGIKAPTYYLRGTIDRSKLNLIDKGVLLAVAVMMKLKGLNEFNKPIFDAMMEGGSFYDESYLDPIEMFVRSREERS